MTKKILLTLIFCCITATSIAQYCACISVIQNNDGTETKSGVVRSNDAYSLSIRKVINNSEQSFNPEYYLALHVSSRAIPLNSSMKTKGKVELLLKDKSKLVLENARYIYDPIASGTCVFSVSVNKEQMEILLVNPIVTFSALGIIKTSFKEKKQLEQQIIVSCLLNDT